MKEEKPDIFSFLISNKDFRDWVLKPNEENAYFWEKWMEENLVHLKEVYKAREFIERLDFKQESLSEEELNFLLGKIIAKEPIHSNSFPPQRGYFPIWQKQWFRIAAILVLMVLSSVLMEEIFRNQIIPAESVGIEWKEFHNPRGKKSKITLPDGTLVHLNHESTLRFPKKFLGTSRSVELTGEAFFEVVPNDTLPFIVQAGGLKAEVLGTSFNIQSFDYNPSSSISLVTGKVRVSFQEHQDLDNEILIPGEQLNFDKHQKKAFRSKFDREAVTAWKDGILIFRDSGFENFIKQLERWYGVDFQVYGNAKQKWKVNGRYQDQKLDDILIGLKFVYDIDYKIQGKNVILKVN
ncbi:FecR family protein [Cyclobacterium plantarum]|uniref:FecR family protein n=1 Tax=Cyclobacterium plantarum TaxID=2716263 RepID=UPI003F6FA919